MIHAKDMKSLVCHFWEPDYIQDKIMKLMCEASLEGRDELTVSFPMNSADAALIAEELRLNGYKGRWYRHPGMKNIRTFEISWGEA